MRYSAICSSNCSARGIFYISCIEAQQLQLAWHVVGVFKGGVATKRVSKSNLPLRATHTREHLRINTQQNAHRVTPTCSQSHSLLLFLCKD